MPSKKSRTFRIAIVEDEHDLRHDLIDYLTWRGFATVGCESADAFDTLHRRNPVDLVLLDLGLMGRSGFEVLKALHQQPARPSVVVLTGRGTDEDRITGLQEGADAYLVKGASLELIEATCLSVLRRTAAAPASQAPLPPTSTLPAEGRHIGQPRPWHLDMLRSELRLPNHQLLPLTHTECIFLRALIQEPGKIIDREQLLHILGKSSNLNNLRNLDNCATRLRRKVMQFSGLALPLRPAYGVGYAFGEEAQITQSP